MMRIWMPQRSCSRRSSHSAAHSERRCGAAKSSRCMFIPSAKLSPTIAARFFRALPKEIKHSQRCASRVVKSRRFRGYEPTGKIVDWLGAALFRFENSVIAELWVLGDLAWLDALLQAQATDRGERRGTWSSEHDSRGLSLRNCGFTICTGCSVLDCGHRPPWHLGGTPGTANLPWGDTCRISWQAATLNPWFPKGVIFALAWFVTVAETSLGEALILSF